MSVTPTLMIPGLVCSARLFEHQANALWNISPVMIANHLHGSTIKDVASSILSTAPARFNLAGLSMGGYISFEILRQAPERVAKLVLMDTSARADTAEQTENRTKAIEYVKLGKFKSVVDGLWPKLVDKSRQKDDALNLLVEKMADECGPDAFISQQKAIMSRPDSRAELASIKAKTLIIVGENDQLTPVDIAKEMNAGIAGSRLEVIPSCGHLSSIEKPAEVSKLLVEFLSK